MHAVQLSSSVGVIYLTCAHAVCAHACDQDRHLLGTDRLFMFVTDDIISSMDNDTTVRYVWGHTLRKSSLFDIVDR